MKEAAQFPQFSTTSTELNKIHTILGKIHKFISWKEEEKTKRKFFIEKTLKAQDSTLYHFWI